MRYIMSVSLIKYCNDFGELSKFSQSCSFKRAVVTITVTVGLTIVFSVTEKLTFTVTVLLTGYEVTKNTTVNVAITFF